MSEYESNFDPLSDIGGVFPLESPNAQVVLEGKKVTSPLPLFFDRTEDDDLFPDEDDSDEDETELAQEVYRRAEADVRKAVNEGVFPRGSFEAHMEYNSLCYLSVLVQENGFDADEFEEVFLERLKGTLDAVDMSVALEKVRMFDLGYDTAASREDEPPDVTDQEIIELVAEQTGRSQEDVSTAWGFYEATIEKIAYEYGVTPDDIYNLDDYFFDRIAFYSAEDQDNEDQK